MSVRLRVDGMEQVQRRLSHRNTAPAKVFQDTILPAIGQFARRVAYRFSPFDTGRLRQSIVYVTKGEHVAWGTHVEYGRELNNPSRGNPRYRRGPYRGRRTAGWLDRTLDVVKDRMAAFIAEGGYAVERKWRR